MDADSKMAELRDIMNAGQRAHVAVHPFNPRYAGDLDTMVVRETL